MAIKTERKTILLISKSSFILEATRTYLAKVEFLHLISKEATSDTLLAVIAETQPDVILLDFEFQNQPFDLLDKIKSEYPDCAVIVILPESEMDKSTQVIRSGARAFIQYPYQQDVLVVTIKRAVELMVRSQDYLIRIPDTNIDIKPKNTFTIFSPKGGAGTTTIATNLAISLQKALKEDVLLIDGKHHFGHVALYLNLHTGNSITDLLAHASSLDERMIRQVVIRHISGIYVLPSPNSIIEAQGIKPENLVKVIQSLQGVFSNIIIDGGNYLNENTVTYMDSSDKILLVLNPDLASLRDLRQFMEISTTLSYPKEKMMLILNLAGRKADVRMEEIEKILKMKIFGKITADENLALSSLNEGIPILLKSPRHPISKAFNDIAADLAKIIQSSKTENIEKEKK
jgi:pilus assembly protein CpaE